MKKEKIMYKYFSLAVLIFGWMFFGGLETSLAISSYGGAGTSVNYADGCDFVGGAAVIPGSCVSPCQFNSSATTCSMSSNSNGGGGWDVGSISNFGQPSGTIGGILGTILMWLLGMIGVFGILGFLMSGSMYLLAAGDDDVLKRAKKSMTFSIVGITIGLIGLIAFNVIYAILDASGNF